jgi:hypothetical protein
MADIRGTTQPRRPAKTQAKGGVINRLSTAALKPQEYQKFQEEFAQLKAKYGADRVKAEANRRPKPKEPGRPKIWHQRALFAHWLIVQTFSQDEPRIDRVCKLVSKSITTEDGTKLFSSSGRVRRLFYESEAEFGNYEIEYADVTKIARDGIPILKERLFRYAEVLSSYELLQFDLSLADRIVFYELTLDGVDRCPCGKRHRPPLQHLPELSWIAEGADVRNRTRNKSPKQPDSHFELYEHPVK